MRDPEADVPSLQVRATDLLGALAVGLADAIEGAMRRSLACSGPRVAALQWVHRAPGLRNEELSRLLGMSQSSSFRLVSMLLGEGLVVREPDPRDGRATRLRTSELGARAALRATIARTEVLRPLIERLPRVWLPRLIQMAERLLTAMAQDPLTGLRICRFCHWATCRGNETAPCPVVLAATTHQCPSGPPVLTSEGVRLYEERRIIDGTDPPVELWLEPGSAAFRLPASRRLEVICRGEQHGHLEEERLPGGHLALYAWAGATFTVLEAGREILVEQRALSLTMGIGNTTREKVESIWGPFQRRCESSETRWL